MAKWSKNNRACKTAWSTLRVLEQLKEVFSAAGSLKMRDLTFYNQTSSKELRASLSRMLATQLDNIFREIRSARYEEGVTAEQAIEAMAGILTDGDLTVADLAETCDESYKFFGEDEE
jgi:uncharacterized protein YicC (UPF0701 family)